MKNSCITMVLLAAAFWPLAALSETYFNQEHEFSIEFPEGWTVKGSMNPETIIKAVYRDEQDRIAQVTIAAYELPFEVSETEANTLTADDMWEGLKNQFADFRIKRHGSGTTKIRSRRVVWNFVEVMDPPQAKMVGKHYNFIRGRYLYRVSAMADSGMNFYKEVLPKMEAAIATLAFGL